MSEIQTKMKKAVAIAAVNEIKDDMVVGLGSGSTAALMIEELGRKIKNGSLKNILGVATSFQGEVMASELGIRLSTLSQISKIDIAIDGADEVDSSFNLIKGGGACHVQEKLVASLANKFIVVVDSTKIVNVLNQRFLLPIEVLPSAWKMVKTKLENLGAESFLRMAVNKAGPIVTDQGNLVLDAKFENGIEDPSYVEKEINNIPGVLENGLFVGKADDVLIGEVCDEEVRVKYLQKT
tara:strand:+ start:515 stop:1228 length:714 start_codon:yes stop_codon:yes gene_type:complete